LWIHTYIGILLGAHYIHNIRRIRVKLVLREIRQEIYFIDFTKHLENEHINEKRLPSTTKEATQYNKRGYPVQQTEIIKGRVKHLQFI
jgi:hypothetical protein